MPQANRRPHLTGCIVAPPHRPASSRPDGKLRPGRLNAGDGFDGHSRCNTYAHMTWKSNLQIVVGNYGSSEVV